MRAFQTKKVFLWFLCVVVALTMMLLTACETGEHGHENTSPSTDAPSTGPIESVREDSLESEKIEEPTQSSDGEGSAVEETVVEETTPEEITTEVETRIPEGGEDHGIVRDGTPKKYFTIRFDDGITQDERIIEILKKYNAYCCTFYINTGMYGTNWPQVGQQAGRPDVPHLRYTKEQILSGIYDGFDVECHGLNHRGLNTISEQEVTQEISRDAQNIQELFGYKPVGVAWPGGDKNVDDKSIETVLATTDIRYGICTTRNQYKGLDRFAFPKNFMTWYPTCGVNDSDAMYLLRKFIVSDCKEDMLFLMWGHGYELDLANSWDQFEEYIKLITEAAAKDDSIVLVTNAEFYQLFKDEIPAWEE